MLPWIMSQVRYKLTFVLIDICVGFDLCCFSGPAEVPIAKFGDGDISTEAETKRPRRSRSLVPLARSASASIDFSIRDHSRT